MGLLLLAGFLEASAAEANSPVAFSADGLVRSTSGGFQFPDGTVQQTAASTAPAALTVQVNCAAGETLTDALALPAEELTIEFTGSCQESLVIRRDRTRLRGITADAEIAGAGGDVISVHGAIDVVLESFTVRGGWIGVSVHTGGAARLEELTVRDNLGSGVVASLGGWAWIDGLIVEDNEGDGIGAWHGARLTFGNSPPTVVRRSGRLGIVVSSGSDASAVFGGAQVHSEDNTGAGLLMQLGASSQGIDIHASGNDMGLLVGGLSTFAGRVDLRSNTNGGLFVGGGGDLYFDGLIQDNGGIGFHAGDATVTMGHTTISGNTRGVLLDGARVYFFTTTVDDSTELLFGTHATFHSGNTFTGGVSCDGTVLVRGDVACTPTASSPRTASLLTAGEQRPISRLAPPPSRPSEPAAARPPDF